MIISMSASAVRSRAKRAGVIDGITIHTGRAADRAELKCVHDDECSVRLALCGTHYEEFLASLPERWEQNAGTQRS